MDSYQYRNNNDLYRRLILRGILTIVGVLFLIFVLPKLLTLLYPFVIASIVAVILNPAVNRMTRRGRLSRRLVAAIFSVLFFVIVFLILGLTVYGIGKETISLAYSIQQNWDSIYRTLSNLEQILAEQFNFLPIEFIRLFSGFEDTVMTFLQNASKTVLNSAVLVTTSITTRTGVFLINFVITVMGTYFIMAEYNSIAAFVKKYLGDRASGFMILMKQSVVRSLGGFLKSSLLLALFAFLFMLISFLIVRQPYALLLALLLGFIDLLPIVGTIAVLLPWSIIEWITGDIKKGLFLIILGVVFFMLRKVVEPKVVGSQTGLHPLAALVSTYVGLQFSGLLGAILGPMFMMIIISMLKTDLLDNTAADVKALVRHISFVLSRSAVEVTIQAESEEDELL